MKFEKRHNSPLDKKRLPGGLSSAGLISRTQTHFADECDINQIVKRYQDHQILDHLQTTQAQYGYAPAISFTEAMQTVALANEKFMELPSEIRKAFNNDTANFLDAADDPTQRPKFEQLGLLEPLPTSSPDEPLRERREAPREPTPNSHVKATE
nr:MAG: internal scaffolding protein [Microvirus sp.]